MANKQSASKFPGQINAQPRLHQRALVELITATLILAMTGVRSAHIPLQSRHRAVRPGLSCSTVWSQCMKRCPRLSLQATTMRTLSC